MSIFKLDKKHLYLFCALVFLFLIALSSSSFAEGFYVSDNFKITLRSGPSTDNKILKMISSGTPLTKLDKNSSWVKVRTPPGTEGWVRERYTMQRTPRSKIVRNLKMKVRELKRMREEPQKLIASLRQENKQLRQKFNQTQNQFSKVKNKYRKLKSSAGEIMEIKKNYQDVREKLQKAQQRIDSLVNQNTKLRSRLRLFWFIVGGGTVIFSAIIGFVLGRIQRKKSKKVYF